MINPHVYHCFEVFETFWILAFLRQQMCEPLPSFLVWSIEIYWNLLILHILRANHFVSLVASHGGIASHRQGREALPRCGRLRNPWWKRGVTQQSLEVTGGDWTAQIVSGDSAGFGYSPGQKIANWWLWCALVFNSRISKIQFADCASIWSGIEIVCSKVAVSNAVILWWCNSWVFCNFLQKKNHLDQGNKSKLWGSTLDATVDWSWPVKVSQSGVDARFVQAHHFAVACGLSNLTCFSLITRPAKYI